MRTASRISGHLDDGRSYGQPPTSGTAREEAFRNKDCLKVNEMIETNGTITSQNGKYRLVLQDDGNFVLYAPESRTLWASETKHFNKAVNGLLQDNGNLRLLDDSHREIWSSRTGGKGNARSVLVVQDDGDVVIKSDGRVIWNTNTTQREKPKFVMPVSL